MPLQSNWMSGEHGNNVKNNSEWNDESLKVDRAIEVTPLNLRRGFPR
jgi:hypothetical protein